MGQKCPKRTKNDQKEPSLLDTGDKEMKNVYRLYKNND